MDVKLCGWYQFDAPFILDSTLARQAFGIDPTPLDDALTAVVHASGSVSPQHA